tara:strand:+ start:737 stop:1270 length:534 start_codon:yes stop_codon:yes gene_type:complete
LETVDLETFQFSLDLTHVTQPIGTAVSDFRFVRPSSWSVCIHDQHRVVDELVALVVVPSDILRGQDETSIPRPEQIQILEGLFRPYHAVVGVVVQQHTVTRVQDYAARTGIHDDCMDMIGNPRERLQQYTTPHTPTMQDDRRRLLQLQETFQSVDDRPLVGTRDLMDSYPLSVKCVS